MNFSSFPVYTVSQLNGYVKGLMESDQFLQGLLIRGEISNYKRYPSGHHYFSLKDTGGSIRCVMFRGDAGRLRFVPENGMSVTAFGRVSVFPRDGQYQLYCSEMFAAGQGDLNTAFEQLKEKLDKEGLFDRERKRPLPRFPQKIALVTSPAGAAVRDMIRILRARWPMTQVLVLPVRVQGETAAGEIAAAIHYANNRADIDLIIAGRGGGSREDLWAFNEEVVARAIAVSNIPVISAVGHEPDVTISDYVADLRASTPSNGAELAVPDQAEQRQLLRQRQERLVRALQGQLIAGKKRLDRLKEARVLRDMKAPIEERQMMLDAQYRRLSAAYEGRLSREQRRFARLCAELDAMSPLKVLGRGYSIVQKDGRTVTSHGQVEPGDQLNVQLSEGRLLCRVLEKENTQ